MQAGDERNNVLLDRLRQLLRVRARRIPTQEIEPILGRCPMSNDAVIRRGKRRQEKKPSSPNLCGYVERLKNFGLHNPRGLVRRPGKDISPLKRRLSRPQTLGIKPIGEILQASRALEDDDFLARRRVPVLERGDHEFRVDLVRPLGLCVDAAEDVRKAELDGQDQGLDVIDVRGFVGCGERAFNQGPLGDRFRGMMGGEETFDDIQNYAAVVRHVADHNFALDEFAIDRSFIDGFAIGMGLLGSWFNLLHVAVDNFVTDLGF